MYMTTDVTFNGASTLDDGTGILNTFTLGATGYVEVLHCVLHGDYTGTFLSPDTPQVSLQAKEVAQQAFALCGGNASQLRSVNTLRWSALWRAQLEVLPNISSDVEIQKLNRVILICMYRLFASTVDATHIGNNVTRSIKPGVEFLTSSFVTLKAAMLLDTYKNFTVSPVVRTSALALYVINAWGVFRSTLDRVWLGDVMTLITKAVDEITSRIQISGMDQVEEVSGVGHTVGRLGQPLEDDAYTTILVKNALEMAIQASYELRMFPRQEWKNLNDSLEMPISGALIQATSATGTAAINPEHIINLHPYYYRQTLGTTVNVLTANKGLADSAVGNADPVLKSAGIAVLTSYLPFVTNTSDRANEMDVLKTRLYELRDLPASEWSFLGDDQTLATISAIVTCIVFGFARTRITGQVSIDGIHTERAAVVLSRSASMPRSWKAIRIKSATLLAPENLTVNIIV
jgi:phage tail protein X